MVNKIQSTSNNNKYPKINYALCDHVMPLVELIAIAFIIVGYKSLNLFASCNVLLFSRQYNRVVIAWLHLQSQTPHASCRNLNLNRRPRAARC